MAEVELHYKNCSLTSMVLTNVGIKDRGAEHVKRLLEDNGTLSSLVLSKNQIPSAQKDDLVAAFNRRPSFLDRLSSPR